MSLKILSWIDAIFLALMVVCLIEHIWKAAWFFLVAGVIVRILYLTAARHLKRNK